MQMSTNSHLSLQVNITVVIPVLIANTKELEEVLHVKFDFPKTTSKLASRFERAKMSKHSRGDQKTIKAGQVCQDRIENASCKLWIQMSTNSHLSLQVNTTVCYSYPDYKCQRIRSGSPRQIQLPKKTSSNWLRDLNGQKWVNIPGAIRKR